MSFDWSNYLDLAQELHDNATNSSSEEANLRSSISRAYYGAYHKARLRLYQKWGISLPKGVIAHQQLRNEYASRNYRKISVTLDRMRYDRNRADYDDVIMNVAATANENLKRANRVTTSLRNI